MQTRTPTSALRAQAARIRIAFPLKTPSPTPARTLPRSRKASRRSPSTHARRGRRRWQRQGLLVDAVRVTQSQRSQRRIDLRSLRVSRPGPIDHGRDRAPRPARRRRWRSGQGRRPAQVARGARVRFIPESDRRTDVPAGPSRAICRHSSNHDLRS
jgi:hypothetical protein